MSIRLQHLREAASFLSSFIGRVGEIAVDLTNNRLIMQDGVTAGGWPAAKLSEVLTNTRSAVADANYTVLSTDRLVAYTAMTAARTVTLPAASVYPTGTRLVVIDESGLCSGSNSITLARSGSDTINGAASAIIASAYGFLSLESNGTNKWTITDQATSNLPPLGIGTPADPSNPLSVFGTAALFNSAGDFNFTINKATSANTASTIYEDGFSGRAQVGLCGDDNFHFKVSPNGSTWYDALDINGSSGNVGIGTSSPASALEVLATTSDATRGITVSQIISSAAGAITAYRKARGSVGALTAVASGDYVAAISFMSYDGANFLTSAGFGARVNGTVSTGSTPAELFFYTTGGTSTSNPYTSASVRLLVSAAGNVGIGTVTPAQELDVAGNIAVNATTVIGSDRSVYLGSFTVSSLPAAGTPGRMAFASNGRMLNGAGSLEGAGAGTGGLVVDNGTAWKIAGTNQTVQA